MDKMGVPAEEAIQRVEDSRGHPMSKYKNVILHEELRLYLRHRMNYFYGVSTLLFHPYTPDSRCIKDPDRSLGNLQLLPHELEIDVSCTPSAHI